MERSTVGAILASVALSASAQVALKAGMTAPSVQRALGGPALSMMLDVGRNPFVLLGLFLYAASMAVWLSVLAKVELSTAYPFVALGFVFTAILGRVIFHDTMSAAKIVGTALIASGVVVLARG